MHFRRRTALAALFLAVTFAAISAGCSTAGFGVRVHEELPIDQISATALARGAEVRWKLPPGVPLSALEPMQLVFLPADGTLGGARIYDATGTDFLLATDLDVDVEYRVQLMTITGRVVSPATRVRPYPTGAIDPVPWHTISDDLILGGFGASVTLAKLDDDEDLEVVVGAPNVGAQLEGRVYVYPGATLFASMPPYVIDGADPLGMFGSYLAPSDDFDADGFDDLLVHSPFPFPPPEVTDTGANPAGVVQVIRGADGAPLPGPVFSGISSDFFGASVIGRNFTGDSKAELLAGGPGASYASVLSSAAETIFTTSGGGTSRLGFSVAAGDFDANGFLDIAIGEPLYGIAPAFEDTSGMLGGTGDPPTTPPPPDPSATPHPDLQYRGRVRVYFADGVGGFEPEFTAFVGTTAGQMLGASLAVADVDVDGIDDLIAGSTSCAIPGVVTPLTPGFLSIWLGGGADDVFTEEPQLVLTAGTLCLGRNVAAGDVNQDGRTDIITGDSSAGPDGEGEVRAFLGRPSGLPNTFSTAIEGPVPGASLGRSIAVGDVDGDGRAEVLAGAPGSGEMAGAAYLFRGAPRRGPAVSLAADSTNLTVALGGGFAPQEGPRAVYTCFWSFGDGVTEKIDECQADTSLTTDHTYSTPGEYIVRLRVESSFDRFGEAVFRVRATAP